jgi:hypothetical protein
MDPWPHSEAGRFHRVISLTLVVLAALIAVAALARNHEPADSAALGALVIVSALMIRLLSRDLRRHPANFASPAPSVVAEKPRTAAEFSGWRTALRERRLNR